MVLCVNFVRFGCWFVLYVCEFLRCNLLIPFRTLGMVVCGIRVIVLAVLLALLLRVLNS